MSELKAFDVGLGRYCEDGSPCVVAFDADQNPRILNEKVYLKSEADKVIAELKAQKAQTEDDCAYWKTMSRKCADDNEVMAKQRAEAFKRERHHKHNLCLAMAEWCNSEMGRETFACFIPRSTKEVWREEHKYWAKWHKCWLELAEKFKEAK